jgi:protein ImuA
VPVVRLLSDASSPAAAQSAAPQESPAPAFARPPAPPTPQSEEPDPGPGTPPSSSSASPANRAALHRAVAALDRLAPHRPAQAAAVSTGLDAIDAALPWGGLPAGMVHEITTPEASGAGVGLGFAALLSARFCRASKRAALWCGRVDDLYAPGLAAFGLDPARLILAESRDADTLAWILEQAAVSAAPAVAVGLLPAGGGLGGAASGGHGGDVALRRLQLAAERGGVAVLLVRAERGPADARAEARGPVATRWRADAAPGAIPGAIPAAPVWRLDLLRCRGGRPGRWHVRPECAEGSHDSSRTSGPAAGRLALVSEPGDGSSASVARPLRLNRAAG